MRKLLLITLVGALLFAAIPGAALAGDRHSGSDFAVGLVFGATAAVVGGVLLNAFPAPAIAPPVAYAPPPAVYAPAPPVVYAPPSPPLVYTAPSVVYTPAPVVVHRHLVPRHDWNQERYEHGRGWNRH